MRSLVWRSLSFALLAAGCGSGAPSGGSGADAVGLDAGADVVSCEGPAVACEGACVDPRANNAHCGECGVACGAGEQCADGRCVCAEGTERCGDVCVDRASNAAHCGVCNRTCDGPTPDCVDGACVPRCGEGELRCGGGCVLPLVDVSHCGRCGNACAVGPNERPVCIDGDCETTCLDGFHDIDPADGCEYRCDPTPGRVEVCDGVDNDCNVRVDADDPGMRTTPCPEQRGVCEGAMQQCVEGVPSCDPLTYSAHAGDLAYQPGGETRCDGHDNDCDGVVDEGCCNSVETPLVAHEAVAPAGFVWQVDRQVRGFWDGEAVVLVWERRREATDGAVTHEILLGRVGVGGGEPRAPTVLLGDGFTAWDAVVDGAGVELWFGDAEGRVFTAEFDLRGTAVGDAVEVEAVGVAGRRDVASVAVRKSPFGNLVFVRGRESSQQVWRLWKLNDRGLALGEYFEPSNTLPFGFRVAASNVHGLIATYSEAGVQLERYTFGPALTRTSVATLFPTTTWPGFVDAEFSPSGAAALVPNLDSSWLEQITLVDSGVERLLVAQDSEPGSTALGRDVDGRPLVAYSAAGEGDLVDTWFATIVGSEPVEMSPDRAVLERRGRIRGFAAMPLDLVEGPERAWVVMQTWSADLRTRRIAVYPLSAEGAPLCE